MTPESPGTASSSPLFVGLGSDTRHAFRLLWKSKGITATTLLTLALCIGATTAIFSTVYSLMLKPLPFSEPDRIVELYSSAAKAGLNKMPANIPIYVDYAKNATSYETIGLWSLSQQMFGEDESVVRVSMANMTSEIFQILRIQPLLGSFFTKEQQKPGAEKVVVLTQSFWQSQFSEDPAIVGKEIRIAGEKYKVLGVAPRLFEAWDARVKFMLPLAWPPAAENPQGRYGVGLLLFGRLKPGATIGQADAEAKTLEKRYVDASPAPVKGFVERSGMTMNVGGVQEQRVKPVRATMLMLQGGVVFVLLIGCTNVANLLLVRSNARQSELAIRSALGASRFTIARQLVLESLLLTGMGALFGLGWAWGALRVTNYYLAKMLPAALPATLDLRVLGFAVGLSLLIGLLIGLVPVIHILRTNLAEVIQRSSRGASSGRGVRALSSILVVTQIAVALVLLTGAGLLIHSFAEAVKVDVGFRPDHVVTGRIAIPPAHRATPEAAVKFRDRLVQSLREIPDVSSVALSFATPFQGGLPINAFTLEQDTLPPGAPQPGAYRVVVTPDYLKTMGLTLLDGRFFEERDLAPGQQLYVVDQSFARKFFPERFGGWRPIHVWESTRKRLRLAGDHRRGEGHPPQRRGGKEREPVHLPDARHRRKTRRAYAVYPQRPPNRRCGDGRCGRRYARSIRRYFCSSTGSLEKVVSSSFDNRRAVMFLLVAFAVLALFLSALGIYGVLAYDVSQQRTREIGVRGAIGASREQIIGLILKQGLWKAGLGVVIGLVVALVLSHYMTTLLFGVKPTDPIVYVAVSVVLLVVALLASYLPARRAAAIDPLKALRDE